MTGSGDIPPRPAERCQSGRLGRSRKPLYVQAYREFESHPLRQVVRSPEFSSCSPLGFAHLRAQLRALASLDFLEKFRIGIFRPVVSAAANIGPIAGLQRLLCQARLGGVEA